MPPKITDITPFVFRRLLTILLITYSVFMFFYSNVRPLDSDEGYYTSAVRLCCEGKSVYTDFFYPQAPAMPYIYSLAHILSPGLKSQRLISVFCAFLTALLWTLFACKQYPESPGITVAGLLLLVLNPYLASWSAVVKTYALSNLCVMGIFIGIQRTRLNRPLQWSIVTGLVSGLLISTRSLYLTIIPLILLMLFLMDFRQQIVLTGRTVFFIGGLFLGSALALYLFVTNTDAFMFNNLGYHMIRHEPTAHLFKVKSSAAFLLMTMRNAIYLRMLLLLSAVSTMNNFIRRKFFSFSMFSIVMTIVVTVTFMMPTPLYQQYFTSSLGILLLPSALEGLYILHGIWKYIIFFVIFTAFLIFPGELEAETARNSSNPVWSMSTYREIASQLAAITEQDADVLSFWPGYVYESGRTFYSGLENHFALRVSPGLTDQTASHFKLATKDGIFSAIESQQVDAIVTGAWMKDFRRALDDDELEYFEELLNTRYCCCYAKEENNIRIFTRIARNSPENLHAPQDLYGGHSQKKSCDAVEKRQ